MKRRYVLTCLAVIAALAIASPVFGLPSSIKKAIKKEVSKQLAGKTGPQGPQGSQGPPGDQGVKGNTGSAGSPAASAFLGHASGLTTSPIEFVSPTGTSTATFSAGGVEMASPNAAIVARDLFVSADAAPGVGNSRQYELRLASTGSAIPVGCAMSGASQTTCDSGVATGTIPAGDGITLRISNSGTPGGTTIEFGWRGTTP
jgi:hypothetical protein